MGGMVSRGVRPRGNEAMCKLRIMYTTYNETPVLQVIEKSLIIYQTRPWGGVLFVQKVAVSLLRCSIDVAVAGSG